LADETDFPYKLNFLSQLVDHPPWAVTLCASSGDARHGLTADAYSENSDGLFRIQIV